MPPVFKISHFGIVSRDMEANGCSKIIHVARQLNIQDIHEIRKCQRSLRSHIYVIDHGIRTATRSVIAVISKDTTAIYRTVPNRTLLATSPSNPRTRQEANCAQLGSV